MYAKIINNTVEKYPYSLGELRLDHPNVSFPDLDQIPLDQFPDLSDFGYVFVYPSPHPEINDQQEIFEGQPVYENGKWIEVWNVRQKTNIVVNQGQFPNLQIIQNMAKQLLLESDYLDLPNTSSKIQNIDEVIAYRDALRIIAINPTDDAIFPEKPEVIWNL